MTTSYTESAERSERETYTTPKLLSKAWLHFVMIRGAIANFRLSHQNHLQREALEFTWLLPRDHRSGTKMCKKKRCWQYLELNFAPPHLWFKLFMTQQQVFLGTKSPMMGFLQHCILAREHRKQKKRKRERAGQESRESDEENDVVQENDQGFLLSYSSIDYQRTYDVTRLRIHKMRQTLKAELEDRQLSPLNAISYPYLVIFKTDKEEKKVNVFGVLRSLHNNKTQYVI